MNERIQELAVEASHQSPDGYPVTIPYSKDFVEKFAELIVRECAQYVEDKFDFCGDEIMIAEKLREHFGVK